MLILAGFVKAQDIPLFTQKLSNSFVYNPAIAGQNFGSITFSHRSAYGNVPGAPNTEFLSFHTPFGLHNFGVGGNLYYEKINIYQNLYASGAFAYHIRFDNLSTISMGVSAEINSEKLNAQELSIKDPMDPLLDFNSQLSVDFSFGVSFRNRLIHAGFGVNRLGTTFGINKESSQLGDFYNGFLTVRLPSEDQKHLIEPIISYRHLSSENNQVDGGIYYTYDRLVTAGVSYRTGSQASLTVGMRIARQFLFGYSYQTFVSGLQTEAGSSNEITLRYDFRDHDFYADYANSSEVLKRAQKFRTKTHRKASSSGNDKKLKKKVGSNYDRSPNYKTATRDRSKGKKPKVKKDKRRKRGWPRRLRQ